MKQAVFSAVLSIGMVIMPQVSFADDAQIAQTKTVECYCTDRYGKRHELGDIICLTVDNRSYEAKCVMALNNPFWRDLNRGCMSSSLPPNMSPRSEQVAALYQ